MKKSLLLFGLAILLTFCAKQGSNTITKKEDYNKFLNFVPLETTSKYFKLWNDKIKNDSTQLTSFGIVAGEYNRYFKQTGDIKYLKKAEAALEKAVEIANIGKAGYRRALARNYISQHRFKEALVLAEEALSLGGGRNETNSLFFDVHMELGNYIKAENYLEKIKNMTDFGYLIRVAKWNDHKGDLDTTIRFMKKALAKAEQTNNKELLLWSYTNLADYYGHAGKLKESYTHYLKSLEIDPANAYAKKGIAWIIFSHEKNPEEALRILDVVTKNYKAPDFYLLKSEIAEYMNDGLETVINIDKYYVLVANPDYGDMYNNYNANIYLNKTKQYKKAIDLCKHEVSNRATPETYGLLAYSYFKNKENKRARAIIDMHVQGKTFEPGILLKAAQIYKATGSLDKAKELKKELSEAAYELGPLNEKIIADL